jgi:hypothetical protein
MKRNTVTDKDKRAGRQNKHQMRYASKEKEKGRKITGKKLF